MEGSSEHDPSAPRRSRKRYPAAFKAELVARASRPEVSVSALAREHGVNANQLFKWIARARSLGLTGPDAVAAPAATATMLPVTVSLPAPHAPIASEPASDDAASVEIRAGQATLRLSGAWDPLRVAALVRAIGS